MMVLKLNGPRPELKQELQIVLVCLLSLNDQLLFSNGLAVRRVKPNGRRLARKQ